MKTTTGQPEAGADFFQTQFAFGLEPLRRYMARLVDAGITERAYFIIGIGPLASARSARWMNDNLFGVHVPEPLIARLEPVTGQIGGAIWTVPLNGRGNHRVTVL